MSVFVITGSTQGIGRALAKYCVGQGHDVLISGRDPTRVEQIAEALAPAGAGRVPGRAADVRRQADVQAL